MRKVNKLPFFSFGALILIIKFIILKEVGFYNFFICLCFILFLRILFYSLRGGVYITVIFFILLVLSKLLIKRNHFLTFLLLIEVLIIRVFSGIVFTTSYFGGRVAFIFSFLVLAVCGACLGLAILVLYTRIRAKEIELFYMKI